MSDDPREKRKSQAAWWLVAILSVSVIGLCWKLAAFKMRALSAESYAGAANKTIDFDKRQIADLETRVAAREAEIAARSEELRQREAAIDGREGAASARTQSSFQGLLIQQQLTKNLEALKASLPDMAPEVEKLAREHAQLDAERQRLEKENAELRLKLGQPLQPTFRQP